jgi:hypothetical protein
MSKHLDAKINTKTISLIFKNFYKKYDILFPLYGDRKFKKLKLDLILILSFSKNKKNQNFFILQNFQIPIII